MLLMVEKGIKVGMCHTIHRYVKANNKYLKKVTTKTLIIISYVFRCKQFIWTGNVSKLPVNGFKWIKNLSKFDEDFIKNYDVDSDKGCILEVDIEYPKNLHDLHSDLPFLTKIMKINKCKTLVCNIKDKETMLFT